MVKVISNELLTVGNLNSLEHHDLISQKTNELYSKSAMLTEIFNFQDIFVHHEILSPGTRTSAPHYHLLREEMIIVLKGSPTCCYDSAVIQLKCHDFVGFKPGITKFHYIINLTNDICQLLVICSTPKDDRVVYDY